MTKYLYDPETNSVLLAEEVLAKRDRPQRSHLPTPMVQRPMSEFVSPVDGKIINSKRELKDHNREHGVEDRREFQGHEFKPQELDSSVEDVAQALKEETGRL